MKSNFMRLSAFLLAGLFIFAACSSDDDKTNKELLTAKSWKVTALFMGGADIYPLFEDCDKDDLHTFFEDGTFQVDEGAIKCDPNDPQILEEGTWTMNADETIITVVFSGLTLEYTIISISESKLEFTYTDPIMELLTRVVMSAQ